jgi:putative flippase GtrA
MSSTASNPVVRVWQNFSEKHPTIAQFLVFFIVSNGVTVLQMILMPLVKYFFGFTSLVDTNFQVLHCGSVGGEPYYVFNYAAGAITEGGGGGLAYFLAVEITMAIAQVINFFLQRNVTFKSNSSVAKAAFWYVVAYIIISIGAAALQGFYKDPIYNFFQRIMGGAGVTVADVVTMIINCAISFWVFFPIFKVIFKQEPEEENK